MNYYIYKIENLKNGKKYIGLTNNIKRRRLRHFTDLRGRRHDNKFLQKEFDAFGENSFSFEEILNGDYTELEIGELEKKYIEIYESYYEGYNQNQGGNFGATNGGTQLVMSDLINILCALEFMNKPGQVLADIYGVSRTTISRIKKGESHQAAQEVYRNMPREEKLLTYAKFEGEIGLKEKKFKSTVLKAKRQLSQIDVYLILLNSERKIVTQKEMAKIVGVKSTYTLACIINEETYKDHSFDFKKLGNEQKDNLASLLRNRQMKTH